MLNLSCSTPACAFSRHGKTGLDFWFILISLVYSLPFRFNPDILFGAGGFGSSLSCRFGEQLYITQVFTVAKLKNPEEMKPNAQGFRGAPGEDQEGTIKFCKVDIKPTTAKPALFPLPPPQQYLQYVPSVGYTISINS